MKKQEKLNVQYANGHLYPDFGIIDLRIKVNKKQAHKLLTGKYAIYLTKENKKR